MKINVGIDLGTTYSCVATFDKAKGMPIVLKNSMNEYTTPSAVLIENGVVKIGQEAKDEISMGNYNAITCFKTFMGDPCYIVNLDGKDYTSEDLSTIFLKHLIQDIEKANNVEIDKVVITMPAYFGQAQKFATLSAGRRAGLNVIRIINEPTAAIIAYGLNETENKNVMVYDLGGGTFDVTIGEVKDHQILILSSNGDHQLGGKNWDHALYMDIIERFSYEYGIEITDFPDVAGELLLFYQVELISF